MSTPKLNPHASVKRTNHLATQFEDELIILGEGGETVYRLDAVGARIWELIEQSRTVSSLCDCLTGEFAVDRKTCEKDVLTFLNDLAVKGLLDVQNGPSA